MSSPAARDNPSHPPRLTEEQEAIVNHRQGHARVSAVAGSGKTTTMVARVGHLLAEGVAAEQILVVMFNRSARDSFAATMAARLAGGGRPLPEVRTFHSLGMRLVNSFTRRGALPHFRLVTEEFVAEKLARQVANQVWRQANAEEGWLSGEEVEEFLLYIDRVKASLAGPEEVFAGLAMAGRYRYFIEAFQLFEQVRREQGIRFYADLIHEPLQAMAADPALAEWVANRVDHIIVDEYQDINETQQQLLKSIAGRRAAVMVVGDVDQCIYAWRGAQPEYITDRFQLDFPAPTNYLLSWTFRYGHQLSLAANHLIGNNRRRDRKLCISHPGNVATAISALAEPIEGMGGGGGRGGMAGGEGMGGGGEAPILAVLRQWRQEGRSLGEAVVLVRLFAQSVPVELALLEAGIPYRLAGNQPVYDCAEILALTGYLELAAFGAVQAEGRRPRLLAMLAQPHLGLKREELELLAERLEADPAGTPALLRGWGGGELPPFLRKRLAEAGDNWRAIVQAGANGPAGRVLGQIVERLGLYDFYRSFAVNLTLAENRVKTCQALIDFASGHALTVAGLLDKLAGFRAAGGDPGTEALLLTSVHRAKGLEWPLVILPGLEEGAFPFCRERGGVAEDLEDERRLFYVAITRARERLVCLHPADPGLEGAIARGNAAQPATGRNASPVASRFLYECNLGLSVALGEHLDRRQQEGEAAGSEPAAPFTAVTIATADSYLQALGVQLPLRAGKAGRLSRRAAAAAAGGETAGAAGSGETAEPPVKPLQIAEIAPGMRVRHPSFGPGTVTAVKDRRQGRLAVHFDDHGEAIILAAYARLQTL